jgi:hypothetical protein
MQQESHVVAFAAGPPLDPLQPKQGSAASNPTITILRVAFIAGAVGLEVMLAPMVHRILFTGLFDMDKCNCIRVLQGDILAAAEQA